MKKFYLIPIVVLLLTLMASATTIYISQSGGTFSGGSACNGQTTQTPAWFNSSANWGTGGSQIGPDTTVLLCGTFTGTAGAGPLLQFQGSGTNGNPIILKFDTGANLTAPYWYNGGSQAGGAINTASHSYLVIDGGTNGIIQNTLNGTSGTTCTGGPCAYQQGTLGVEVAASTYVEVKNLTIANLYTHCNCNTDAVVQQGINGIEISSTASYITIDNNTIHDGGWLIVGTGNHGVIGPGNNLYNADHDIVAGGTTWTIYGNHFHDWALWDNATDADHHDGIHCFAGSGGNTQTAYIYNNQFDGATGANMNQFIFLEGAGSSTTCMLPGGTAYIFNNVWIGNSTFPAFGGIIGNSTTGDTGDLLVNNTGIGLNPGDGTFALQVQDASNVTVENNAVRGTGVLTATGGTFHSLTAWDYNAYENCTSYNCFYAAGVDSGAFSVWQAGNCTGTSGTCDPHGLAVAGLPKSSSNYFGLNAACVPSSVGASCAPTSTSPLRAAGKNLYSLCNGQPIPGLGALCSDFAGIARPSSGNWDAGAIQYNSGTTSTTGAVVQGGVVAGGIIW